MKHCTITDTDGRCRKRHHGRNMCLMHYERWKKSGDPLVKGDHHRGEKHHAAKLSEADVRTIRSLWNYGQGWRQNALAKEFHVTAASVNHICHRRTWAHVA